MSQEKLRRNRTVGADTMKITVVGAILIAAVVIASVLLILSLNEENDGRGSQQNGGSHQDQFFPGTGA